ncbi:hypothetical protein PR048_002753 [Dryococelus australis]|uniref:DUF5641 domain-containing protein n=1 Tax=Dryococelus australis TaxID=614101 RepID=A0ABQ9IL44_9NEOP|nr:hypothetical protein PR048_002753 [Dryococelus australis]
MYLNDLITCEGKAHSVQIHQSFWKRWHVEYLHHLQPKVKWNNGEDNIAEGSLVLNLVPWRWKLGRMVKIHPGADDAVHVGEVRTQQGTFARPAVSSSSQLTAGDEDKSRELETFQRTKWHSVMCRTDRRRDEGGPHVASQSLGSSAESLCMPPSRASSQTQVLPRTSSGGQLPTSNCRLIVAIAGELFRHLTASSLEMSSTSPGARAGIPASMWAAMEDSYYTTAVRVLAFGNLCVDAQCDMNPIRRTATRQHYRLRIGAAEAERLACSPPTKANRQVGIVPDDAVGRRVFSGISRFHRPFIPAPLHIDSQDLAVKSRPNLFTHSLTHLLIGCYDQKNLYLEDPRRDRSPDFRMWESLWSMLLVGGYYSRGSPVSSALCIPALLRTHLTSSLSAPKALMFRAAQISLLATELKRSSNTAYSTCSPLGTLSYPLSNAPIFSVPAGSREGKARQVQKSSLLDALFTAPMLAVTDFPPAGHFSRRSCRSPSIAQTPVTHLLTNSRSRGPYKMLWGSSEAGVTTLSLAARVSGTGLVFDWLLRLPAGCWRAGNMKQMLYTDFCRLLRSQLGAKVTCVGRLAAVGTAVPYCEDPREGGGRFPRQKKMTRFRQHLVARHLTGNYALMNRALRRPEGEYGRQLPPSTPNVKSQSEARTPGNKDTRHWAGEVMSTDKGGTRWKLSSVGMQGRGKWWEITEITHRLASLSGTITTCENPEGTPPEIELGSPWLGATVLAVVL